MAAKKSSKKPNVSAEELTSYYRDMLLIRRFEEKAGQLYGMGLIGGFCHLYIGQEAVVVGLEAAAEEGDKRVTSYRDHGHMLACGMDPNGVMAELTGPAVIKRPAIAGVTVFDLKSHCAATDRAASSWGRVTACQHATRQAFARADVPAFDQVIGSVFAPLHGRKFPTEQSGIESFGGRDVACVDLEMRHQASASCGTSVA